MRESSSLGADRHILEIQLQISDSVLRGFHWADFEVKDYLKGFK